MFTIHLDTILPQGPWLSLPSHQTFLKLYHQVGEPYWVSLLLEFPIHVENYSSGLFFLAFIHV
jgi:hypothetical protein